MGSVISRPLMLFELIPHSWQGHLRGEREAINQIGEALRKRADSGEQILPNRGQVFRALELSPENVRVLIVGQDPYPNSVDACGLAFSVAARPSGLPGSLLNIQKEIMTDIGKTETADGDLSRWSQQGVMLLNRVLTVTAGRSGSHVDLGWQSITKKISEVLAASGAIALLWGNTARELEEIFPKENTICGVHPSPLSAHRGFLGSKPFSKVNQRLMEVGKTPIRW
jgi:uracil-DNA glycosylase